MFHFCVFENGQEEHGYLAPFACMDQLPFCQHYRRHERSAHPLVLDLLSRTENAERIPLSCDDIDKLFAVCAEEGLRLYRSGHGNPGADKETNYCPDDTPLLPIPLIRTFLDSTRRKYGNDIIHVRSAKIRAFCVNNFLEGYRYGKLLIAMT